ncbi:tRNA 2-thiocytidine biosynthesis TtcA family protein [Selenomonas sputigena]|uniref:tRNA 2-thiocytidine biosynthesis TtcA family protein n=1 Tax=Selenomonas sputigena TaxID=69823 RepID=A0ABV3X2E5_9FIRM
MNWQIPQLYFSKLMRAVVEFQLINEGDKILIGISGGKDSIFLAYALAILKKRMKKAFCLGAITIDPQFTNNFPVRKIASFCAELDIPFTTFPVNIAGTIHETPNKNPCFTCAFFRRGAINNYAKEHDYNKVAYAHHNDDAVETLLMGLLYSGQIHTFTPKTYLDRTGITVIRPLIYFREQEIREAVLLHGFRPIPSPCPLDGTTMRQEVKELVANWEKKNPQIYGHLAAAMRKNAVGELWPAEKTRDEMLETYRSYKRSSILEPQT